LRQVSYLQRLYGAARSTEHKIRWQFFEMGGFRFSNMLPISRDSVTTDYW